MGKNQMNFNFIQQNRNFLQRCCLITRIMSWLIFFYPLAWFTAMSKNRSLFEFKQNQHVGTFDYFYIFVVGPIGTAILSGLLVLTISNLLQYLIEQDAKETLLVRQGDKIFYLYTLTLISPLLPIFNYLPKSFDVLSSWSFLIPSFLTIGVKVSLLILSGIFFKRLVESIRQTRAANSQG
jgi:hypothetical protein